MENRKLLSLVHVKFFWLVAAAFVYTGCATTSTTNRPSGTPDTVSVVTEQPVQIPRTVPRRVQTRTETALDTVRAGRFDNGKMWTFDAPPVDYLRETYGFEADQEWLEKARLGALRFATYCSASFVSPFGLVMTNHHCGRDAVLAVNGPGENLVEEGFYAPTLDSERKVDGLFVDQLVRITDVTAEVDEAMAAAQTDAERVDARREVFARIQSRLLEEMGGEDSGYVVQIISLYHGGRYSAYTFRRYNDVRLVMTPELQLGYFGGDTDNFTYPRYALDMTFFRVYGEDGQPLQTDNYFAWSKNGAAEGELVFVIGNPGSTNRLETVAQLEFRRDVQEKYLLALVNDRVQALKEYAEEYPSDEIQNDIFSLMNTQKLYTGRVKGLNDPVLLARRRDTERQFREAIEADASLRETYGGLIDEMAQVQQQKREVAAEFVAYLSLIPNSSLSASVLRRALVAYNYLEALQNNPTGEQTEQLRQQMLGIPDQPDLLEQRYVLGRLRMMQEQFGADSEIMRAVLAGRTPEETAEHIVTNSVLSDSAKTATALSSGTLSMDDPALQFAQAIMPSYTNYRSAILGLSAREGEILRQLGRARFDIYGTSIPPDATFSLRIADGVVAGYPYNGTIAPPHTTFYGLYDRYYSHGPGTEWDLPERWLNPPETFDLSTPVNLVSTNDIIGGNSGSPLINKDLEVVGLVFDGNIESLPSSFIFRTENFRAVSVDSRGMLEALDEIYDADRIVLELSEKRLVATEAEADAN